MPDPPYIHILNAFSQLKVIYFWGILFKILLEQVNDYATLQACTIYNALCGSKVVEHRFIRKSATLLNQSSHNKYP